MAILPANAQPYGAGKYNSNTPYGSETSLSISAAGSVTMTINPSETGTLATATNNVTVFSTDVVGYKLYIRAIGSTTMTAGTSTIPASANVTANPLALNTWGYNTNGTNNFTGVTTTDTMLKNAVGPFSTGDLTAVSYGLNIDRAQAAGSYVSSLIYTAVPQTN
ncbi:hypothetical protein H7200_02310 [Candidatus Saccharibacteria bacterium]|nr:hypothetical protein [Candidatus Saccharibacteria bacterium]